MTHPYAVVDVSGDVLVSRHQTLSDAIRGEQDFVGLARRLAPRACPRVEVRRDGVRVSQEDYLSAWTQVNVRR